MGDLSEHFSKSEFTCKCGCGLCEPYPLLIPAVEQFRSHLCELLQRDVPVRVSSGHRCEAHNRAEGGDRSSLHLHGKAIDVHTDAGLDVMFIAALHVSRFRRGGIGVYEPDHGSFLHLDVRGYKSRWMNSGGALSEKWELLEKAVREENGWSQ